VAKTDQPNKKLCEDRLQMILSHLRKTGNVRGACRLVGISKDLFYIWRDRSAEDECPPELLVDVGTEEPVPFWQAVESARDEYKDVLMGELHRRAVDGVPEPLYHQGARVYEQDPLTKEIKLDDLGRPVPATVLKFSDQLLQHLTKGVMPETFRENVKLDADVRGGLIAVPLRSETLEEWTERHADVKAPEPEGRRGPAD
jgi:hypothetical protein